MAKSKAAEAKPLILDFMATKGGAFRAACGHARIAECTGYDYMANDPEFSEAVKEAKARGESVLVSRVTLIAANTKHAGQLTALMFLLNTTHGYARRTEVSVKEDRGAPSDSFKEFVKVLDQGSDEDRADFASIVERLEGNGGRQARRVR